MSKKIIQETANKKSLFRVLRTTVWEKEIELKQSVLGERKSRAY